MNTAEELHEPVSLSYLIDGLVDGRDCLPTQPEVVVTGVQMDSRLLNKGDLFIACFGRNHDARDYIKDAIDLGVAAVLAEAGGNWQGTQFINEVPVVAVENLSARISEVAARFFGHPSTKLTMFGVTGTNGKTSCSQFIAQALCSLDLRCGVIGTLGYGICGDLKETRLTTPDAVFTQSVLAEMTKEGVDPVVMEVSSVGLHQKRVKSVRFDTAIFTNLSRDHLDYHDSMESYLENKKKLFRMSGLRHAIINLDDPYSLSIINDIAKDVEISTYSVDNRIASIHAEDLELSESGYKAVIHTPIGSGVVAGPLFGYFNFSNLLAVTAALLVYLPRKRSLDIGTLCQLISNLRPVNGRMEIIGSDDDITAVVDYAHTPDGLRCALQALRDHFSGNIWCVFGCGGNRDQGKRPMMGEVAESFADRLIVADDNPRTESGDEIVKHIMSGISAPERVKVLRDRADAINYAVGEAQSGDVVLVAGKGHETYQDVAGNRRMFSDANQVRLALKQRSQK